MTTPNYGYWKTMVLKNVESWKDGVFNLSPGLNVIEAKSETGKSVPWKCIRIGCNYDDYSIDNRKTIIRNWHEPNPEPAIFAILTSENYFIKFQFNLSNMEIIIIYPDKSTRYIKGPADQEVKDILGLVQHKGYSRIINILDNEEMMLMESDDFNQTNTLLHDFSTNRELEFVCSTAESNITLYKEQIQKGKKKVQQTKVELAQLPQYGDLDYVEQLLNKMKYLDTQLISLENIDAVLKKAKGLSKPPVVNTSNLIDSLNKLNTLISMFDSLDFLLQEQPSTIDTTNLRNYLDYLDKLIDLQDSLDYLFNLPKPRTVDLMKPQNKYVQLNKLMNLQNSLMLLASLKKPEVTNLDSLRNSLEELKKQLEILFSLLDLFEVSKQKSSLKTLDYISELHVQMAEVKLHLNMFIKLHNLYATLEKCNKVSEDLDYWKGIQQELFSLLKVCPTCGTPLSMGGDKHERKEVNL